MNFSGRIIVAPHNINQRRLECTSKYILDIVCWSQPRSSTLTYLKQSGCSCFIHDFPKQWSAWRSTDYVVCFFFLLHDDIHIRNWSLMRSRYRVINSIKYAREYISHNVQLLHVQLRIKSCKFIHILHIKDIKCSSMTWAALVLITLVNVM